MGLREAHDQPAAAESFLVKEIPGFAWPAPVCKDLGQRRDNDYKNVPAK